MKLKSTTIKTASRTLFRSLHARDPITAQHVLRVQVLALALGRAMEVSEEEILVLKYAALLHDIGKIQIPDNVLQKPEKLTDNEWETMQAHVTHGSALLRALDFPEPVRLVVEQHHERWDGAGYPNGLAKYAISQGARILSVVDTYDALTNDRPYHPGASDETAAAELLRCRRKQFQPAVVDAFLSIPVNQRMI